MTKTQTLLIVIIAIVLVALSGCTEMNMEKNMEQGGMPAAENPAAKETKEAVIKGDYQEIDLRINATGYSPNVIIAKKNIPLRLNIYALDDAGTGSTIIFPDFGIEKNFFPGSLGLIQISPTQEGTFKFRCPMDMHRGELIIK
jgi:plastocyanin domain-containing protein